MITTARQPIFQSDVVGPITYNYSNPQFLDLSSFMVPCTPLPTGFDGTAFTCTPGTRHFGNEGIILLVGPAFRQMDFSMAGKDTHLTERLKMELPPSLYKFP